MAINKWDNKNALLVQNVPHGTPKWIRDATPNDSDKSFTVPTGKIWDLKSIYINFITTATVGNRIVNIVITDGTNEVFKARPPSLHAASLTKYYTSGMLASGSTFVGENNSNGYFTVPEVWLPAGYVVRISDGSTIDTAADDLTVNLHVMEFDAALMEA